MLLAVHSSWRSPAMITSWNNMNAEQNISYRCDILSLYFTNGNNWYSTFFPTMSSVWNTHVFPSRLYEFSHIFIFLTFNNWKLKKRKKYLKTSYVQFVTPTWSSFAPRSMAFCFTAASASVFLEWLLEWLKGKDMFHFELNRCRWTLNIDLLPFLPLGTTKNARNTGNRHRFHTVSRARNHLPRLLVSCAIYLLFKWPERPS